MARIGRDHPRTSDAPRRSTTAWWRWHLSEASAPAGDPVVTELTALLETAPTPGERLSLMLELSDHLGPLDAAEALHYAENAETLATA